MACVDEGCWLQHVVVAAVLVDGLQMLVLF